MLKVRTKQEIANEILELEAVKKSYYHFLTTAIHREYPENIPSVELNYHIVKFHLTELYTELKNATLVEPKPSAKEFLPVTVRHSADEVKAILAFNKDRRFSITE